MGSDDTSWPAGIERFHLGHCADEHVLAPRRQTPASSGATRSPIPTDRGRRPHEVQHRRRQSPFSLDSGARIWPRTIASAIQTRPAAQEPGRLRVHSRTWSRSPFTARVESASSCLTGCSSAAGRRASSARSCRGESLEAVIGLPPNCSTARHPAPFCLLNKGKKTKDLLFIDCQSGIRGRNQSEPLREATSLRSSPPTKRSRRGQVCYRATARRSRRTTSTLTSRATWIPLRRSRTVDIEAVQKEIVKIEDELAKTRKQMVGVYEGARFSW